MPFGRLDVEMLSLLSCLIVGWKLMAEYWPITIMSGLQPSKKQDWKSNYPTLMGWDWNRTGFQPFRVMVMYRVHGVRTQTSQMNAVRTVETQIIASLRHVPLSFRTPWGIPRGREKIHRWHSEWQGRGKGSSCRGKPLCSPVIMPIWTSPFPPLPRRNAELTADRCNSSAGAH